jgi:hypothetical protein
MCFIILDYLGGKGAVYTNNINTSTQLPSLSFCSGPSKPENSPVEFGPL